MLIIVRVGIRIIISFIKFTVSKIIIKKIDSKDINQEIYHQNNKNLQ